MSDILSPIAAFPAEKCVLFVRQLKVQRNPLYRSSAPHDVVIIGGGMVGLALQLKKTRPTTSILVVEKQDHPVPEAAS